MVSTEASWEQNLLYHHNLQTTQSIYNVKIYWNRIKYYSHNRFYLCLLLIFIISANYFIQNFQWNKLSLKLFSFSFPSLLNISSLSFFPHHLFTIYIFSSFSLLSSPPRFLHLLYFLTHFDTLFLWIYLCKQVQTRV